MKKIILIITAFITLALASCVKTNPDGSYPLGTSISNNPFVIVIDSCEYVIYGYGMSHKGNCKYCQQRRQQEYEAFFENFVIELY